MSSSRHRNKDVERFGLRRTRKSHELREVESRFLTELRRGGTRADDLARRLLDAVMGERDQHPRRDRIPG